jgi:hypothetical protein
MRIDTYYSRLVRAGRLNNPTHREAAQDLARAYNFLYVG